MLTEQEKKDLKLRIDTSIVDYKNQQKKKVRIKYAIGAVAAMVIILLLPYSLTYFNQDSAIENYVNNVDVAIDQEGDVKLLLGNNEEVKIKEKISSITYSDSGKEVRINNAKKTTQVSEDSYNTIIVPYGKRTKILLSEGTQVWINSGSKLTYPVSFDKDNREVHLVGEAIFDVAHDAKKPFVVVTEDYDVKVLGTVFNVSSYQDDKYTTTALATGSVEIQYNKDSFFGKSILKITPGTLAEYNNQSKKIKSEKADVSKHLSWRDGKFIFKKEKLAEIAKKLSRYYNVEIIIENDQLETETFSGHLDLKDTIEKVIEVIRQTSDLDYKKVGSTIVIN